MLCDRHYFTFPQHLNQDLGTQAYLKRIQWSWESTGLPFAKQDPGRRSSLKCGSVYRGRVDVITGVKSGPPYANGNQRGERRRQTYLFLLQRLSLSSHQQLSDQTGGKVKVGVLPFYVKLSKPAVELWKLLK